MRTRSPRLTTRIFSAAVIVYLAGTSAGADAIYQVADLGEDIKATPNAYADTAYNALISSQVFPVRIDSSGQVTNGGMGQFNLALDSAIQAPYPIGNANVFPAVGGSQYQVGWIKGSNSDDPWQAFVWNGQSGTALGAAPPAWGQPGYGPASVAFGVNDSGQVVGAASSATNVQLSAAVTWGLTADGSDPLAPLHSQLGSYSAAFGINNNDQIVGTFGSFADPHAFLFTGNQLIDLNSLIPASSGWTLISATGINDQGQIVGYGTAPDGRLDLFLLTPGSDGSQSPTGPVSPPAIPEPSTLVCFAFGTASLLLWRSRRIDGSWSCKTRRTLPDACGP